MTGVNNAARDQRDVPHGTDLLPCDLAPERLATAPVLSSVEVLFIDGLTDDEDDAFAAALSS